MDPKPYEKDGHRITINTRRWSVDQTSGFVWNLPHGYHPTTPAHSRSPLQTAARRPSRSGVRGKCLSTAPVEWIELPEGGISFFNDRPNETGKD